MHLERIDTLTAFHALAPEWNELLFASASRVPFLRHEYLSAWWQTLGGGEWQQGELCIVAARDDNGRLLGLAPLFSTRNITGAPATMLIGSIEISDYLDLIARPEHLGLFAGELLAFLSRLDTPAARLLDFYNLLEGSPTLLVLDAAAAQGGWAVSREQLQHCPVIPLPGDWETYLAGIDKKQRHEIRRKMRRAEENETPVGWYIVADEASLDTEIEAFLQLMAHDPEKQRFLSQTMRQQMRHAVHAAFRGGWLQLAFLTIGGEKAAGYLNFDDDNRIWVYNSGIDFRFRELSPGWVLLGRLLQWANEQKRAAFDFMRGDEEYKYRFGGVDRRVMRWVAQR